MAQSPIDTSWTQHGLDTTLAMDELVAALPPPWQEPRVAQSTMVAIGHILSAWRDAERLLGEQVEASPRRTQLTAKRDALRSAYHLLFEERNRRPEPSTQLALLNWDRLEAITVRPS